MVLTKTCERCGDSLVIETLVEGFTDPIMVASLPTALGDERGTGSIDLDGNTAGEAVRELFGLVAVPESFAKPAWVVSQYTTLGQLHGHRLHRVHECLPQTADAYERQRCGCIQPVDGLDEPDPTDCPIHGIAVAA